MTHLVTALPGDGIGPEVTAAAVGVAQAVTSNRDVEWCSAPFGGAACLESGDPFPADTRASCAESSAVLLGAVGLAKPLPAGLPRPEQGLLGLRKSLGTYANLRPVRPFPALFDASPLKSEVLEGVNLMFVRELTGGIYFGHQERTSTGATDTCVYTSEEVERIVQRAGQLAATRRGLLTSVDKANVLETSRLWREVTSEVIDRDFPTLSLDHVLVDAMAMHLLHRPRDFDVIVTENMFGDILTDEASMLCGSLGMLPSASLGEKAGIFEPIHGSAPDIAGQGIANPCGAILSAAMMLRHSLDQSEAADAIESAVEDVVEARILTPDLGGGHTTAEVTAAVMRQLE